MKRVGDWTTFPVFATVLLIVFIWRGFDWLKVPATAKPAPASGCLTAQQKISISHGIAARSMPANWLIGAADLSWSGNPAAVGKYVHCPLAAGDPIITEDLAATPIATAGDNKLAFQLDLDAKSQLDMALNAGMQVQVFLGAGAPIVSGVPVLAVTHGDHPAAYLEVTPDQNTILQHSDPRLLHAVRQK